MFEQACTDFSKSGGIQISTASFRHILKNRYMPGPTLLDFSILCFSCIAIYNYIFGNLMSTVLCFRDRILSCKHEKF